MDSTSERFANVLGMEYFKKSIHQTLASRTQKFHPKSHPSRCTYPLLGPIYSTKNQEYVGCDSRSMCHLVHFERRGIRGNNSISMEFQNFRNNMYHIMQAVHVDTFHRSCQPSIHVHTGTYLTVCLTVLDSVGSPVGFALASFSRTTASTLSNHLSFSFAHPFSFLFTCHQHIVTAPLHALRTVIDSTGDDSGGKDRATFLRNLKIILRKSSKVFN